MDYMTLLEYILEEGEILAPRGQKIKELNHVELTIEGPQIFDFRNIRELPYIMGYWGQELAWYFSGDRRTSFIEKSAKLWGRIRNPDETSNSNYGHLVFYNKTPHPSMGPITKTPFEWAVYSLEKDRESRQAVMTYNTGAFNFEGNNDYICTQHQAFFIRKGRLECYIALRSSDAIFGLTYNMPWWSIVHQQLFLRLKEKYPELQLGAIRVTIYSAHIYEQHWSLVRSMLATDIKRYQAVLQRPIPLNHSIEWYVENMASHIKIDVAQL